MPFERPHDALDQMCVDLLELVPAIESTVRSLRLRRAGSPSSSSSLPLDVGPSAAGGRGLEGKRGQKHHLMSDAVLEVGRVSSLAPLALERSTRAASSVEPSSSSFISASESENPRAPTFSAIRSRCVDFGNTTKSCWMPQRIRTCDVDRPTRPAIACTRGLVRCRPGRRTVGLGSQIAAPVLRD